LNDFVNDLVCSERTFGVNDRRSEDISPRPVLRIQEPEGGGYRYVLLILVKQLKQKLSCIEERIP